MAGHDARTVFRCWKCSRVLKTLVGRDHAVLEQVKCPGCGALNALTYAFPVATVETVYVDDAGEVVEAAVQPKVVEVVVTETFGTGDKV